MARISDFTANHTGFKLRMQVVIVKNNFGMGYGFRNQYELLLVFEKGEHKYKRLDVSNVLYMEHIQHDESSHPHEKGVELLKNLIDHASEEGDTVLDCFAGSGSTLVAAQAMNRNFIGIELDPKYCKIAQDRLDATPNSLFS